MRRPTTALLILALLAMAAALAAAGQTSGMAFRSFTVEGRTVTGQLRGPWTWTGGVTVKGSGITLNAENLKVWPSSDGRDADRIEATGNVKVEGRFIASDQTTWDFSGKAAGASYDRAAGEGVMRGEVAFRATNTATGAVISAAADRMVYTLKTRQFRFERGDRPVRMEWQEPAPATPAPRPEAAK